MDEREVSEMQKEMMTVLVVEPMKAPYVKSIPNELEDLQCRTTIHLGQLNKKGMRNRASCVKVELSHKTF